MVIVSRGPRSIRRLRKRGGDAQQSGERGDSAGAREGASSPHAARPQSARMIRSILGRRRSDWKSRVYAHRSNGSPDQTGTAGRFRRPAVRSDESVERVLLVLVHVVLRHDGRGDDHLTRNLGGNELGEASPRASRRAMLTALPAMFGL